MLNVEKLVVRYGPFLAIDGVDVAIDQGEIVGLIGSNGAGKTSLIRAIAGTVPSAVGRISFYGESLSNIAAHDRIRVGISIVPEGRGLFPSMSVEENLMMGGYALDTARRMKDNIRRCYSIFPILEERQRQMAGTLSGGQGQMLAIAMGLMADPKILILDEPSLGLAPIIIGEIGRCLASLKSEGVTILLAEQNANLTTSVADRIYVMQHGRIRYHDTPAALSSNPEVYESFLSI